MPDPRDDERVLRDAFARLSEEEARLAPALERLVSQRAEAEERAAWERLVRLRFALPLAGAALAALAWLVSAAPPRSERPPAGAAAAPARSEAPLIALGSLRSPTDALLAPPLRAPPGDLSQSLIPAPPRPAPRPHSSAPRHPNGRIPA